MSMHVSACYCMSAHDGFCRDLKRDIAEKLSKLERRTQRAIVELTRERIQAEQSLDNPSSTDLAAVVSAATDNREGYDSD